MEHIQCHLFTILHKYASLVSVFKRKGQALSEYGLPNYPSSLHLLNLTNASLDLLYCCCYCSFLINLFNNDIYIFDRVMFVPRATDVCVSSKWPTWFSSTLQWEKLQHANRAWHHQSVIEHEDSLILFAWLTLINGCSSFKNLHVFIKVYNKFITDENRNKSCCLLQYMLQLLY